MLTMGLKRRVAPLFAAAIVASAMAAPSALAVHDEPVPEGPGGGPGGCVALQPNTPPGWINPFGPNVASNCPYVHP
jgi:hypothetical protein